MSQVLLEMAILLEQSSSTCKCAFVKTYGFVISSVVRSVAVWLSCLAICLDIVLAISIKTYGSRLKEHDWMRNKCVLYEGFFC